MIRDRIAVYIDDPDPGRMLLIAAPAGIGKTTLAVETAERWAMEGRAKVLYAGPRKDFYADIRLISARAGRIPIATFENWWYPWQGHHDGGDIALNATCRWANQIHSWMQRGYGALAFCQQPRVCGWNYINNTCPYHRQRGAQQPIIYAQYEHISLGHPLLEHCGLVIGDELPLRAFLRTTDDRPGWIIPPDQILPRGTDAGPLRDLLIALQACTVRPAPDAARWSGTHLLNALGGPEQVLSVYQAAGIPLTALAYAPDVRNPYDVEDVPYFHLRDTLALLKREAEAALLGRPQIARVHVDRLGLHLLMRRETANLPPHVIWLDATANAAMYETLFGRPVEVVQPDVRLRGHIYQMWASLNNKGQFMPGATVESVQTKHVAVKIKHIQQQIAQIAARGYKQIGYIGHKSIVDQLAPDYADSFGHFGGARGTNRFEDCDCLIVIGTPQPTTAAMIDIATMLYEERDDPFDATWSTRDLPFEGLPYSYPIGGFWNDPDLQTLLEQFRDAELVQAIHRARPLRRSVDIWLLSNIPLRGLAVELISLHQLFGAVTADGRPLPIKDPYIWPTVMKWADQTVGARAIAQLVAPDFMRQFGVTAPTARQWMDALVISGAWQYMPIASARPGRLAKAICKAFPINPN